MTDLDKKFGVERIIDTPVSESAVTGAGVALALAGKRPIVVHPRMDFMLYNRGRHRRSGGQVASYDRWLATVPITVEGTTGSKGAAAGHCTAGVRISWPARGHAGIGPDARDLRSPRSCARTLVVFIDDRWLCDLETPIEDINLLCCG